MIGRNNIKKITTIASLSALLLLSGVSTVKAQNAPDFPTCSNPQGQLKTTYSEGEHAIPGESSTRSGSDSVYDIGDGNYVQCFCAENGQGVQTNWWRISALNQNGIDTMIKLGWNFIPSGADWGLDASAYLALNTEFSCGGGNTSSTPTPTPTPTSTSTTTNNNEGVVLAAAASDQKGSVLAATGTSLQIAGLFILGLILLISGRILKKREANS